MATRKKTVESDSIDSDVLEPGTLELDLDDEPEVDDDPAEPSGPSRAEKKAARQSLRDETERVRQENAVLARELAESRAREAAANGFAHGLREAGGGTQKDPLDAAEEELDQQNNSLIREYQAVEKTLTEAQRDQFRTRASALEKKKFDLRIARANRNSQPSQEQVARQENHQLLVARYPDVCADQRALNWATLEYQKAVIEGQPGGWETTDAVMRRARTQFKMGDLGKRQADPANRTRLAGQPRGASAGGGGEDKKVFRMGEKEKEMADAAYPHIKDEKVRYAHFAKKIVERKAARGED